jgi:hypothetical protein
MRAARAAASIAALASLAGCARIGSGCASDVCTTGTVLRVGDDSTATWDVRGDDGTTYVAVPALPALFQRDGLRVRIVAKQRSDHAVRGTHPVEIVRVETLDDRPSAR